MSQFNPHSSALLIQYVDSYISFEENRKSADSPQIVEYLCVQLSFMDKLIYEFQRGEGGEA